MSYTLEQTAYVKRNYYRMTTLAISIVLGIRKHEVYTIARGLGLKKCPRSDRELIRALAKFYKLEGEMPAVGKSGWADRHKDSAYAVSLADPRTYQRHFGKLSIAQQLAYDYMGLKSIQGSYQRFSTEELARRMAAYVRANGQEPRTSSKSRDAWLDRLGTDEFRMPSPRVYARYFGSLKIAREAARKLLKKVG